MPLGGFAGEPQTDRLFLAVYPDAQTAQRIVQLARSVRAAHAMCGNPLRADRAHVTLHHLGDHAGLPEKLIAKAGDVAARMSATPFDVSFDCVASFPGRARKRPCVLRSADESANTSLSAFQVALGERLRAAGLGRYVERRFTPHVTLLYDEPTLAPEPVEPVGWSVLGFALVHSLIGRGEYRVLGRWTLPGDPGA